MFLKNRSIPLFTAVVVLISLALVPSRAKAQDTASAAEKERKLIGILQSDAPPDEKAVTCKRLAVYGSDLAVPVLAPLLLDEKLASWARIALEAIPGETADAALRSAIPKLQGRLLVGTINSIGVRRDAKAVADLSSMLKSSDTDVACAAAVALGRIGGASAASVLSAALSGAPQAVRPSVAEGCVRCAERFLADAQPAQAIKLYDLVRKAQLPKQNILEGIRGAILARQDDGIPLLLEQLRSTDKALFQIGLRVARELPGAQATKAVVAEMLRAPAERKPQLLLALADRPEDPIALQAILEAAGNGPKQLRMVAVGALDRLGNVLSVPVLITVAAGNDADLTKASLVALTRMPGNDLDAKILEQLGPAAGRTRQILIELSARRQIQSAIPVLVKDMQNPEPGIRSAAVQAVGAIGNTGQVNDLVVLLSTAKNEQQRQDIETALLAISGRIGAGCVQYLVPLAQNQDSSVRKVALHALASAGGPEALAAVSSAVEDRDESVQVEAVRTLSTWPNTWPEDESITQPLLSLAKNSKKPNYQVLALRGYLQFLQGDKKLAGEEKLSKVRDALPLMARSEEKQSAIAVIQTVPTASALEMLVAFAQEPAVAEDACSAIVDLAGKNMPGVSGQSRRLALQTPIEKSSNEATKKKATAALAKIH
jgi:HEAT repeat protein